MKKIIVFLVVLVLLGGAGFGTWYVLKQRKANNDDQFVYVENISDIMGYNTSGSNRYMGVVEAQETKGIEKDQDKKVKEVYVKEEQIVKEGDKLFEYDTEEMNLSLRKLELELSSIYDQINTTYEQINSLAEERETVPDEKKMEYTAQIQNYEAMINQYNYDASAKQLEIDRMAASMENSVVYSPMDGIVKSVKKEKDDNNSGSDYGMEDSNYYGMEDSNDYGYSGDNNNSNAFITIMANGQYRIKGTGDEMTLGGLLEQSPVIIRSRVDENVTWNGVISLIDREHPVSNNDSDMYMSGGGEKATKYPFYIELDNIDGLMLGQHVYIENDLGQGNVKSGIWLYEYYIMQEDGKSFVWVENEQGRITKTEVMLGEYDDMLMAYEITAGLSKDSYIAYPESRIVEGMKTTRSFEESIQATPNMDDYNQEDIDFDPSASDMDGFYKGDDENASDTDGFYDENYENYDIDNSYDENYDIDNSYEEEPGEDNNTEDLFEEGYPDDSTKKNSDPGDSIFGYISSNIVACAAVGI